jgi:short subunit dehydrogenase-like uncharacterized protein
MIKMTHRPWMLYGAYGFTGGLILEEAIRRRHKPALAGRDGRRIEDLAKRHGLQSHVLSLDDPAALRAAVRGVELVVNAAGPISETGPKLIAACLDMGTAYVDVSGEFHHLQFVEALDARAKQAGIVLLTGAGFGVTYGDCLARYALDRLPNATYLRLSVAAANAQTTPGAQRTIVGVLAKGSYAVEGGRFRRRPLAHQTWTIRSTSSEVAFAAAPLGELAALRRSTGIADIVVGRPMPAGSARILRLISPLLQGALAVPAIRRFVGRDRGDPLGSSPTPPGGWRSRIWAEAHNDRGDAVLAQLETGEGYAATAEAALANIEALFAHRPKGAFTPGLAFGSAHLASLPRVGITDLSPEGGQPLEKVVA